VVVGRRGEQRADRHVDAARFLVRILTVAKVRFVDHLGQASEAAVAQHGLEPQARFVSFGLSGVDPYRMLHGNPEACARALAKAGLTWDDVAVIEVNEAFASVILQFLADTGLRERWDAGDVNPNGGGISLGHPLGATGARITATLLAELERRGGRYGVATMCIGLGQAIAAVIERV